MKKLTELAINRPLFILVIFTILTLFGIISYKSLNYNLLPRFDANVVSVITTYRGASADEIENNVTKHIEDALSSLEGIKRLTSSSQEGASIVTIELIASADVNKAQNDAQRKVDQIALLLPKDVDRSIVNKFSSDNIPVMRMGIAAQMDDRTLFDIVDQQIKPQLGSIPGVGQINLIGGSERQITISANAEKLKAYHMSIAQLAQIVNFSSLSTPAGQIKTANNQFSLKFDAKFNDLQQLKNMIIQRSPDGGEVRLSDVADVMDGQVEASNITRVNGIPSIGVQVMKQTDANAVEVSKLIKEKIATIEKSYENEKLHFNIASDQSTYTLDSADAVMEDLTLAVIIVSIVMLMFLHSLRSSLFVLVALPASIIPTFLFMNIFGMSLNMMTLMALSLVVGILVDDSIVILENIMRHMEMGKNKRQATIDGRSEIGFTAMAITMVDVVVFLPMALTSGMIGNILREFALVVVSSTLMSLFVCFTITPLLASRFARVVHLDKKTLWGRINIWFETRLENMRDGYGKILKWALHKKRYVFIVTILLLIGSGLLVGKGFIGFNFISKADMGELVVKLEMDPNASLYQTSMAAQDVEKVLLRQSEVENLFSNVGFSSSGLIGVSSNTNIAEINVKLVSAKERKRTTEKFTDDLIDSLQGIAGAKITIGQMDIMGNTAQSDIQVVIKGPDRDRVKEVSSGIKKIVEETPGTQYVEFSTKKPKPQIEVQLDRQKMAIYAINPSQVAAAIASSFRGDDNAKFTYKGNEYNIMVQNDASDRSNIDNIKNLSFVSEQGLSFNLAQFADIHEMMGETVLQRTDRLPSIIINAAAHGRAAGTIGNELKVKLDDYFAKLDNKSGVSWEFLGMLANTQDSFASLLLALGIGIVLVYLVMVALYENAIYPFVVLFALPLAMIGAFLALALTMNELTIFAMIGLIMLMGLVAKNGILLVDFTNQRKAEGAGLIEALTDAGRERFRPILMTTIAMIVGMMPIALATSSGAEIKNGMAWVIIGGLTSSLLLTLLVVPCVYYIVDKLLARFKGRKRRKMRKQILEKQMKLNPSS